MGLTVLLNGISYIANTIADLDPSEVTTVAWVPEMALSGAAVIALGAGFFAFAKMMMAATPGLLIAEGHLYAMAAAMLGL
ncbi:MAG: hypothetical protein HRT61_17990, partial [Ekhidna sp.]|nr:hypothetical protein [Ekhidna sp.]